MFLQTDGERSRAAMRRLRLPLPTGRPVMPVTLQRRSQLLDAFLIWATEQGADMLWMLDNHPSCIDSVNLILERYGWAMYSSGKSYGKYAHRNNVLEGRVLLVHGTLATHFVGLDSICRGQRADVGKSSSSRRSDKTTRSDLLLPMDGDAILPFGHLSIKDPKTRPLELASIRAGAATWLMQDTVGIEEPERKRANWGNTMADFTFKDFKLQAVTVGGMALFEQPDDLGAVKSGDNIGIRPASMWQWEQFEQLLASDYVDTVAFYQQDFGTEYLKPTRFLLGHFYNSHEFFCSGPPVFDEQGFYAGPLQQHSSDRHLVGASGSAFVMAFRDAQIGRGEPRIRQQPGKERQFHDGAGLTSMGRWDTEQRIWCDIPFWKELRYETMELISRHLPDERALDRACFEMAVTGEAGCSLVQDESFKQQVAVSSLAILVEDNHQGKKRIIHDATHGTKVNNRIGCRDKVRSPSAREKQYLLAYYQRKKKSVFSLVGDMSKAHRRFLHEPNERGLLACRVLPTDDRIYINCVGTFGVACASYWWARIAGCGVRWVHELLGTTMPIELLILADDVEWIAADAGGHRGVALSFLVMSNFGFPFKWSKQRGGLRVEWIGLYTDYPTYRLGLSPKRAVWMRDWVHGLAIRGTTTIAKDFEQGLGRLGFSSLALVWERPCLGPLYIWAAATRKEGMPQDSCHSQGFAFISQRFDQGGELQETPPLPGEGDTGEEFLFLTDAKATESGDWIGGFKCSSNGAAMEWFSEEIKPDWAEWMQYKKDPKRLIASLELLASLVAVKLWMPQRRRDANATCWIRGKARLTIFQTLLRFPNGCIFHFRLRWRRGQTTLFGRFLRSPSFIGNFFEPWFVTSSFNSIWLEIKSVFNCRNIQKTTTKVVFISSLCQRGSAVTTSCCIMDIVLKDTKGVSPETIISIRAGATRRQVPVSLVGEKPFKFPCTLRECGAIKVDLLTVTASARAVLTPESDQQTITLPIGKQTVPKQAEQLADDAEVTLLVSESGEAAPVDSTAKKKAIAGSAEEYMEKHGVHSMLQGLLSGLIKDRPDDPYSYVASQFKSKAKEKAPVEDLRTQARDALLQGARSGKLLEVLRDGSSPKNKRGEQTPTGISESEVSRLRSEAAALLLKGAQSGKLFEALQKRKTEDFGEAVQALPDGMEIKQDTQATQAPEEMDILKQKAREALLTGAQSGALQAALAERSGATEVEKLRAQAREVLLKGAQSGKLQQVLASHETKEEEVHDIDQIRGEAYTALLEAAESGKLEEILSGASGATGGFSGASSDPDLLRKLARATLMEGVQSGKLQALAKRKAKGSQSTLDLRGQARAALLEGASSGKLQELLAKKQKAGQSVDPDALRQQARQALLEGATSGKLQEALAKRQQPSQADGDDSCLRAQAAAALLEGVESGKLQKILATRQQPSAPENDDVNTLRQQAREALLEGAQSGKLLEILQAKGNESDEMESLRAQAREALMEGMASGKLEEMLSKKAEDSEVNDLRQQALQALLAGAQSGKLSEILTQKTSAASASDGTGSAGVEALRQQAREALLDGAQSGKLQEVLAHKEQEANNVEDLRVKARDALLAGAQSGKLQNLLTNESGNEMTQKPETLKESLPPPPADREKIVEMQTELKLMSEQNKKLAAEKECLEQLVAELEAKNAELKSKNA
eukprot:s364_g13.t1